MYINMCGCVCVHVVWLLITIILTLSGYVHQHVWVCMCACCLASNYNNFNLEWLCTFLESHNPERDRDASSYCHYNNILFLLREGRRAYINIGGIDVFILILRIWLQYNSVVII